MNTHWQQLLRKIGVWLVIEILLTILGIDDLADYSEFIYEKKNILVTREHTELISTAC